MIRLPAIICALALCCLTAQQAGAVSATGGSRTNSYVENGTNFTAHIFTNNGTLSITTGGYIEFLVVGGGASGGRGGGTNCGGGGGGGGVLTWTTNIVPTNAIVTVGLGGTGRANNTPGTSGGNSSFLGISVLGGGGGGGGSGTGARNGGCGGGGGGNTYLAGGLGTVGQGYDGGASSSTNALACGGGGGGGAGVVGADGSGSAGGNGGSGTISTFAAGTNTYYGGGGGGSGYDTQGLGGLGGGTPGKKASGPTLAGTDGLGGGSGGGHGITSTGKGGSGTVIVRYATGGPGPVAVPAVRSFYKQNQARPKWKNQAVKNQESPL